MFVKDPDIIYKHMRLKKLRYWQIFDTDKTTIVTESLEDDSLTIEDSINELASTLTGMEGVANVVIRSDEAKKKRKFNSVEGTAKNDLYQGIYKFSVRLEGSGGGASNYGGQNMFAMMLKLMDDKHEQSLKHMEEKHSLEKSFNDKFAALEKKLSKRSGDPKMNKKIMDVLDRIMNK